MSLDFYPAQRGQFFNRAGYEQNIRADEPNNDFSDMRSLNSGSAAKLIPLLALSINEDGYGEITAADLYQRCYAVLLKDRAVIEEFTCAKDTLLAQVLAELGASSPDGPQLITIGTDADTVEGLRRRIHDLMALALLTIQRHGARGCVQMC
jgi:hypothetical protein